MDGCRTCTFKCRFPVLWGTCDELNTWLPTPSSDWNGVGEQDETWMSVAHCWMSCADIWTMEGISNLCCKGTLRPPVLLSLSSSFTSIALLPTLLLSLSFLQVETGLLLSAMTCRLPSLTNFSFPLFSLGRLTFHRGSITLLWWWPIPAAVTYAQWSLNGLTKFNGTSSNLNNSHLHSHSEIPC